MEYLRAQVELLNSELRQSDVRGNEKDYIAVEIHDDDIVIAICTPFMKRVHEMVQQSSELVFIDSSGNVDRLSLRVFLLMTYSPAGGLPLGAVITTNHSHCSCTTAF